MPLTIVRQDITQMRVDAIVNAANTDLAMGGGVCGAIFQAAGPAQMQAACDRIAPIQTGEAVLTPGFRLPAKFVIHAVGPVYRPGHAEQSRRLLYSAYTKSLQLALAKRCRSIAFPLISSGIYGYPKDEALQVATAAIQDFLAEHDMEVYLVVFDRVAFAVSEKLLGAVENYLDDHYVDIHRIQRPGTAGCRIPGHAQRPGTAVRSACAHGCDPVAGRADGAAGRAVQRHAPAPD